MDNNQIVGRDCSLITIVSIIQQSTLIQSNWSTLARRLNVSSEQIKRLRQDYLFLSKITFEDLIFEVLEIWIGKNGGNATLSNLLEVVEGHCEANDVGELLRLEYKLSRKLADSNHSLRSVGQHQSSLNFQEAKPADDWRKPASTEPSKVLTPTTPSYHLYFNLNGAKTVDLNHEDAKSVDHPKGAGSQSSAPVESTFPVILKRGGTAAESAVAGVCASTKYRFFKGSADDAAEHTDRAGINPQPIYTVLPGALSKLLNSSDNQHAVFYNSLRKSTFHLGEKSGDQNYVNMPLSNFNGMDMPKWNIVLEELTKLKSLCETGSENVAVGLALAESLRAYSDCSKETNFGILEHPDISQQLTNTLPTIVEYAIQLPNLLGEPIPYLKQRISKTIYVTRRLACSLMAHCFLCTVPHEGRPYYMPYFHLFNLFHMDYDALSRTLSKVEKLKCILDYFDQMANISRKEGYRIISFERRCIPEQQDWNGSEANLCDFSCNSRAGIETAEKMLQVVSANKRVGEGIFGDGMLVEEFRFVISPELILSRLFTESLQDDEVLIVTGTRHVNEINPIPSGKDSLGREYCQVVLMDALHFTSDREWTQFKKKNIDRELHKCYVGFSHRGKYLAPVATGNWGCDVLNGDKELKILLQWMAASIVGRPCIAFYTPVEQSKDIEKLGRVLQDKNVSVGKLYELLMKYEGLETSDGSHSPLSVFQFILNQILISS